MTRVLALLRRLVLFALGFLSVTLAAHAGMARFAEHITFTQPDGTELRLRGEGNEYRAVYETDDGYTVVFVPETRSYHYAALSADATELVSSGLEAGQGDPDTLGLPKHLRIRPDAAREQARRNRSDFESRLAIRERWARLQADRAPADGPRLNMLRYGPTVGAKCGLTFLVDFDDTPGTVPPAAIEAFLNGDNYRANGNNGSVKEYYRDVSAGKLLYTNLVIGYIRIPRTLHPRSYYNDINRLGPLPISELVRDAIQVLTNQPNYRTEILPRLGAASLNDAGEVLAANFFVAGAESGVWSKGLWPTMDLLMATIGPVELWPGGIRLNYYQMSTLSFGGAPLQTSVFCHETGHLLCGFPDLYDYDGQSAGGTGDFCLMGLHGSLPNPVSFCAYLRYMAGWATVTELLPGQAQTISLSAGGTDAPHFLRYRPVPFTHAPGREYYLIENRQKTGRDALIPGSGIFVWHIDELGNNSDESLLPNTTHSNYEVTLVQADGRWDLESNANFGDVTDPFHAGNRSPGYRNRLSDTTSPGASWWDGTRSGLELRDFSTNGLVMTFIAEARPPILLRDPLSQVVNGGDDLYLTVLMATNRAYSYTWTKDSRSLTSSDRVSGADGPTLRVRDAVPTDAGNYRVIVSGPPDIHETSRVAQVTIANLRRLAATDLGDAGRLQGNTVTLTNGFRVTAAGSGFSGVADGFRFLSESVTGDFDVRLQVADMNPEDGQFTMFGQPVHGQAGLMVRADLDPGSPSAAVILQPDLFFNTSIQGWARLKRASPPAELAHAEGAQPLDNWIRLKREGSLVSLYYSADGKAWDALGTVELPLGAQAYVGPAVTSGNPVLRVVTRLHSYSLQTNAPPTLAISAIRNSAREGGGEPARLAVTASRNGPWHTTYSLRDSTANGTLFQALDGQLEFPAGTNVAFIDVVPIDNAELQPPTVVTVSVNQAGVSQSAASVIVFDDDQTGRGLKREVYNSVPGTAVADLTAHYRFPGTATLGTAANFEATTAQEAGQVLSGYLTPPVTGPYVFYLASANASELWLSPDVSPERAVKIAEELGTNTRRNWAGYGTTNHISAPVPLEQGRWYYVRALHKAGLGTPLLAVAWQPPGSPPPTPGSAPISGDYLAPSLPPQPVGSPAPLRLTTSPEGRPLLSFDNPSGKSWALEASSDLRNWTPIGVTNRFERIDLGSWDSAFASRSSRFYRLKTE